MIPFKEGDAVKDDEQKVIGELGVRAPQLFTKYWGRPDATRYHANQ